MGQLAQHLQRAFDAAIPAVAVVQPQAMAKAMRGARSGREIMAYGFGKRRLRARTSPRASSR